MKKFINTVFGNEINWFKGLNTGQRIRVIYAGCSVVIPLCCVSSSILVEILIIVNAYISVRCCKGIDFNKLEE